MRSPAGQSHTRDVSSQRRPTGQSQTCDFSSQRRPAGQSHRSRRAIVLINNHAYVDLLGFMLFAQTYELVVDAGR